MASGRRVYRNKDGIRKRRKKIATVTFLIILGAAVLTFLGFAVAPSVKEYFVKRGDVISLNPPWSPNVQDDNIAEKNPPSKKEDNANKTEDDDTPPKPKSQGFSAYSIPVSAMASSETLKETLVAARTDGYSAAVVTLKAKGGKIYYKTEVATAYTDETAVAGELSAEFISAAIVAAGLKPIALVNILEDNNRYGADRKGSYKFAVFEKQTWLDNNPANGGKPWLSPFDNYTKIYAAALVDEVSKAGYEAVIIDGLVFPPLRTKDADVIGDTVKDPNRYLALVGLENALADIITANGSKPIVSISAEEAVAGIAEVFKPDLLKSTTVVVRYSPATLPKTIVYDNKEIVLSDMNISESTKTIFEIISAKAGADIEIIPLVNSENMNYTDFSEAVSMLINMGYISYVIN